MPKYQINVGATIPLHRPKDSSINAGFDVQGPQGGGQVNLSHNFGQKSGMVQLNGVYSSNVSKIVDNVLKNTSFNLQLPAAFRYGRGGFGYSFNPSLTVGKDGHYISGTLGIDGMNKNNPLLRTNFNYNNGYGNE